MSRAIAVLRPEPGNRVTAAAIEARGRRVVRMPLFAVQPVPWEAPQRRFDALILTSANAVRHGGAGLAALLSLPVHAVGAATAAAARRAGFDVAQVGEEGAAALIAHAQSAGVRQALHLAGRERTLEAGGIITEIVTVYSSEEQAIADPARLMGTVALVQSTRAAARLARLAGEARLDRSGIALVAVSAGAAAAAGDGWERVIVPAEPSSEALIDAAIALAD